MEGRMRTPGITPGTGTALTEDYKRRVIKRALAILRDGYSKRQAEKIIKHDMEFVEVWAAEYQIAWPEKHKRKIKGLNL
jgi:hypothetical protein